MNAKSIGVVVAGAFLTLLAGCLAAPKPHSWQISKEDLAQIQDVDTWTQLPTNEYARVQDSNMADALTLLQNRKFVALDASQLSVFAPNARDRSGTTPYLVRGVSCNRHPVHTIVRFDVSTGRLFVQQATYDGEMIMPYHWVEEANALVAYLPRAPDQVYAHPLLGGTGYAAASGS
jgi:hypothetical protein